MDGHHMFSIYGTLIIVIIYQIYNIISYRKINMVSEQDWALLPHGRAQEDESLKILLVFTHRKRS
jgi:hypothetical protein